MKCFWQYIFNVHGVYERQEAQNPIFTHLGTFLALFTYCYIQGDTVYRSNINQELVPDFCVMLFLSGYESGTKWYDRNSSTYSNSQI